MDYFLYYGVAVLIGYLLGSIPVGYLVGMMHGVDLTAQGSGSTGTTNALRTLGTKAAIAVLLGDFGKGIIAPILAVYLTKTFFPGYNPYASWIPGMDGCLLDTADGLVVVIAAFFCLVGHVKSIWIGFRGGKAVAAGVGTIIAINPQAGIIIALIWVAVVFFSRISSLGALTAMPLAPVVMYFVQSANPYMLNCYKFNTFCYVGYCVLGALYIIYKHQANIQRLIGGTEPKIGDKR